jgi:hypothetical protein
VVGVAAEPRGGGRCLADKTRTQHVRTPQAHSVS